MKRAALMVWGASSGAGKSLLTTALCRWAARQGLDVAPFKAQNMSNNARVVPVDPADPDSRLGEIGSAQYFQALAARVPPSVDMNPVLLKPERDTASRVVVHGQVDAELSRLPWRERSRVLAAVARESFDRLTGRHGRIVIEGAGSPAEINLAPHDYVNLDAARWAREHGALHAMLVADIDRGGAFAHLHGTWALLPDDLRPVLAGFVLNKFRGDAALLAPGPAQLQALTGVPLLGVLPMRRDHGLPDEDGVHAAPRTDSGGPRIAIVAWPHISNLDEFQSLAEVATLRWARNAAELADADWIILPGSKQVSGDLAWLREQGLDRCIVEHVRRGRPLLGICGGQQILGRTLDDPGGVDGEPHGPLPGLGLLPLATRYAAPKRLRAAAVHFDTLTSPWQALTGRSLPAYEIRCGRTTVDVDGAVAVVHDAHGQPIGWQAGATLGLAVHGLFEDAATLHALFGRHVRTLDARFDALADLVEDHLGAATLRTLLEA
ncbi:cobyric acid synthase [Piscinibacter koreensis]|uniref:Cobyric acid synthase n=1 Tax=Piscinibacter koreensis TaxID=2742824 RepID=A0A7Y6NPF4_9BURK|nr:cobyric acid synthase [Schlegelella koreensis]NUZ06779.1 cobyric acid synthase [Schlegelella koreensis]